MDSLKELVQLALENDDINPLVRAVFEVQPAGEPLPEPPARDSESGTTSLDAAAAAAGAAGGLGGSGVLPPATVLETVLGMLQDLVELRVLNCNDLPTHPPNPLACLTPLSSPAQVQRGRDCGRDARAGRDAARRRGAAPPAA